MSYRQSLFFGKLLHRVLIGHFKAIDRKHLDKVMAGLKLSTSNLVDTDSRKKLEAYLSQNTGWYEWFSLGISCYNRYFRTL
ncbi:MAG: hypothetical protein DRH90_16630 [Deltaproteobacteria bacterium]|nr:MAG: hypothetical protein DRH90_16630 [Deltaproteobacteria bacterium]RLC11359.1 MAG: hypothetical protein DRI24_18900 [Deltaproteobacteria bacterium]